MSSQPHRSKPAQIAEQAAAWLARRDRGLTAAEQDEYVQWLGADPRHAEAVTQHAAAFERMMTLYEWQPGQSAEPNPDLFAPRRHWRRPLFGASLAAAASLALCAALWWRSAPAPVLPAVAEKSYLRVNERHALADGSIVELNDGSRIAVEFSAAARRVQLVGEGHFNVAKDPARPFIVDAGGVAVRAIGTAFNVRIEADAVDVLVTEGRVRVQPPSIAAVPGAAPMAEDDATAPFVSAWQRAVVNLAAATPPQITDVSRADIADALAWQVPRLQFFETPLAVAIAEFNQRSTDRPRLQLVLGDDDLRSLRIGGTFRVDNIEGFVRLLEVTLDLRATPRGANELVLTRAQ